MSLQKSAWPYLFLNVKVVWYAFKLIWNFVGFSVCFNLKKNNQKTILQLLKLELNVKHYQKSLFTMRKASHMHLVNKSVPLSY